MGPDTVRRLARRRIDRQRWDQAVAADPRPLPYGLAWWLDAVTDGQWDGLIVGDYRTVLPLPRARRFGVLPCLIRPPFTQQLGPFGASLPDDVSRLLAAVPRSFQVSLPLRHPPSPFVIPPRFTARRRTNLILPLAAPIAELRMAYPGKLRAFLRQTTTDRLEPMAASDFVVTAREQLAGKGGLGDRHFRSLHRLICAAEERGMGRCHQLREEGVLLAANFTPRWRGRTINLAAVSTDRGRKRRGMSRLLDLHFQAGAGDAGAVFDFEGSELPGVRDFFAKFGGVNEGYLLLEGGVFGRG